MITIFILIIIILSKIKNNKYILNIFLSYILILFLFLSFNLKMSKKSSTNTIENKIFNISKSVQPNPDNFQILCPNCYKIPLIKIIDNIHNLLEIECNCGKKKINLKNFLQLNSELKCKNCNKIIILNKETKFCNECKGFLCKKCDKTHKKKYSSHKLIENINLNCKCFLHNKNFIGYCINCKEHFCEKCQNIHIFHNMKFLEELKLSQSELNKLSKKYDSTKINIESLIETAEKEKNKQIQLLEKQINSIKNIINKFIENHRLYLNFYQKILGNYSLYNPKLLSYEVIINLKNNFTFEILKHNKNLNPKSDFSKYMFNYFITNQNYKKPSNPIKKIAYLKEIFTLVTPKNNNELICIKGKNIKIYDIQKKKFINELNIDDNLMNYISYVFCLDNKKLILVNFQRILVYIIQENNFIFEKQLSIRNTKSNYFNLNLFHIYEYLIIDKDGLYIYQIEKPYEEIVISNIFYLCMCEYPKKKQIIFLTNDSKLIIYDLNLKSIKLKKNTPNLYFISSMKYYYNNKICMFSSKQIKILIFDINNSQVETILNTVYLYRGIFLKDKTFLFIGKNGMHRININNYEIIEKIDINKFTTIKFLQEFGNKYIVTLNTKGRICLWEY